jgi:hypothetical protein
LKKLSVFYQTVCKFIYLQRLIGMSLDATQNEYITTIE